MNSNSEKKAEPHATPNQDGAIRLILSMADTTWRMFTPPAILVSLGIFADLQLGTKPWITAISAPVGLLLSVMLVKKQLEKDV
jgi:hypothetical protein